MYEPIIDPETGKPYDEEGVCFGPAIPVAAGERIELNHVIAPDLSGFGESDVLLAASFSAFGRALRHPPVTASRREAHGKARARW